MSRQSLSPWGGWSRRLAPALLATLLLANGCIARHIRMEEKGLTCGEAHRIAMQAVARMGYAVTEATRPATGVPGIIVASRQDGTNKRTLMVTVVCTGQGAEVEAKPESGGIAEMNFPAEFRRSFAAAAANQGPPRAPAERGLDVLLMPERDGGRAQLGVDLSSAGVLPVSVRITNHTGRTYGFSASAVSLQTSAGARIAPLTVADLGNKVAPAEMQAVRPRVLEQTSVAPGQTLSGFLLFPFDAYSRARVDLIDLATDEAEGFAIEF